LRRGAFAIACNLGTEPVTVPVRGEVVLAWEQPTLGETTVLPGHSFAILRGVNEQAPRDPDRTGKPGGVTQVK
jgi:maltooligosyltrehalose trehalohydrolase